MQRVAYTAWMPSFQAFPMGGMQETASDNARQFDLSSTLRYKRLTPMIILKCLMFLAKRWACVQLFNTEVF